MRDSASHSPDSAMLSASVVSLERREDATFAARRLVAAVFQSVLEYGVAEHAKEVVDAILGSSGGSAEALHRRGC